MQDARPGELIRFCLENREGAWEEFLRRYGDLIYSTIQAKVGLAPEDRADAFQNTVLSIYQNLHTLRDPSRLVAWIIRVAYFQGVDRVRARMRAREAAIGDLAPEDIHDRQDVDADPDPTEDLQTRLERAQRAQELLALLPEKCRSLLHQLFYEDPTPEYSEISRRVGIPVGSIGPTRARCLEKMRLLWEERGLPE
jgi:RNA polymerase sigma factor (sigma-70 family)